MFILYSMNSIYYYTSTYAFIIQSYIYYIIYSTIALIIKIVNIFMCIVIAYYSSVFIVVTVLLFACLSCTVGEAILSCKVD